MAVKARRRRARESGPAVEVECGFCGGKGRDPFGLMSPAATCQVCGGSGVVGLRDPMAACAFCSGTGVYPGLRLVCTGCGGVGSVEVPKNTVTCPHCHGAGRAASDSDYPWTDSSLPCTHCGGTGLMVPGEI